MSRSENPPRLEDLPDVLHIEDVAAILRVSRTSAYDYARAGQLPAPVIRCGRRLFVSKAALLRALEGSE
jgi:predicted site-specific integrase-resolvase